MASLRESLRCYRFYCGKVGIDIDLFRSEREAFLRERIDRTRADQDRDQETMLTRMMRPPVRALRYEYLGQKSFSWRRLSRSFTADQLIIGQRAWCDEIFLE